MILCVCSLKWFLLFMKGDVLGTMDPTSLQYWKEIDWTSLTSRLHDILLVEIVLSVENFDLIWLFI